MKNPRFAAFAIVVCSFGTGLVAQTDPTLRVTGRLLDEDGIPVQGARFTTGYVDELVTKHAIDKPAFVTRADGRFDFSIAADVVRLRTSYLGFLAYAEGRAAVRWGGFVQPFNGLTFEANEAQWPVGDLVMGPGKRLKGQVTDEKGIPIAGAYVRAVDILMLDEFSPLRTAWFSAAVSEADGRFTLEGVAARPIAMMARASGHFDCLKRGLDFHKVALLTLPRSGYVSGQILDAGGKGVAGHVFVDYEGYNPCYRWDARGRRGIDTEMPCQVENSDGDGRFRVTIRFPGLFRLHARGPSMRFEVSDEVRSRPSSDLELQLSSASQHRLTVTAVTATTGQPIGALAGVGCWGDQRDAGNYKMAVLVGAFERHRSGADGKLRISGPPAAHTTGRGSLLLAAKGYAPLFVPNFKFPDKAPREYKVRLSPESAIAGRVLDRQGERGLPGVEVVCTPLLPPRSGHRQRVEQSLRVATGQDGSFRIGGLRLGTYSLQTRREGFAFADREVVLGVSERIAGLKILAQKTWRIAGRVIGKVPAGMRLVLDREFDHFPTNRVNEKPIQYFRPVATVDVDAQGAFVFSAQSAGKCRIQMRVPQPSRIYYGQRRVLKTFDLKSDQRDLKLTLPSILRTWVTGRVVAQGSAIPLHRVIVAAVPGDKSVPPVTSQNDPRAMLRRLPHVPVNEKGEFRIRVLSTKHRFHVYDAITGLRLFESEEIELSAATFSGLELSPKICRSEIALVRANGKNAEATAVRIMLLDQRGLEVQIDPRLERMRLQKPKGAYQWVGTRPGKLVIYTPPGGVRLEAESKFSWVRGRGHLATLSLGKVEFTAAPGEVKNVRFVVDEIPDFEGKPR